MYILAKNPLHRSLFKRRNELLDEGQDFGTDIRLTTGTLDELEALTDEYNSAYKEARVSGNGIVRFFKKRKTDQLAQRVIERVEFEETGNQELRDIAERLGDVQPLDLTNREDRQRAALQIGAAVALQTIIVPETA